MCYSHHIQIECCCLCCVLLQNPERALSTGIFNVTDIKRTNLKLFVSQSYWARCGVALLQQLKISAMVEKCFGISNFYPLPLLDALISICWCSA